MRHEKTEQEKLENRVVAFSYIAKKAAELGAEPPFAGCKAQDPLADKAKDSLKGLCFFSLRFCFKSPVWGGECETEFSFNGDGQPRPAEVSWSSTGRTVAMAVATIAIYQKAIELAAFGEAVLNRS